jgi:succinoglycan biosynthesis transport protein ExoP
MLMHLKRLFPTDTPVLRLLSAFWQWRAVWIGSTLLFTAIGLFYALFLKSNVWVATQGMIVRDEATATAMRLGRFESQTQMKTAQEMLMELARNPSVIRKALSSVPQENSYNFLQVFGKSSMTEPTSKEIEAFGKRNVTVRAPHGAELGTTEIIYLDVKLGSKQRAIAMVEAITGFLEQELQQVRQSRAEGIIAELRAAEDVADSALQRATKKLQSIEIAVGTDLADLRGLTDANTGSTNRLMLDMVRDDLRKGEIELQMHQENLESVRAAIREPDLLAQVTDRLTDTQPTIKKLREALAEAYIRTTQQMGRYSELHPEVLVAQQTEVHVRQRLMKELEAAGSAIEGSIALTSRRMQRLHEQEQELGKRLNLLAQIRADYTNTVAEVKARSDELHSIRRDLTQALAARDAASKSSLITRLDNPILGEKPLGPGRTTIAGAALFGGLMLGLGVVFLLVPIHEPNSPASCRGMAVPVGQASDHREPFASADRRAGAALFTDDRAPMERQTEGHDDSVVKSSGPIPVLGDPAVLDYQEMYPLIASPFTNQFSTSKL